MKVLCSFLFVFLSELRLYLCNEIVSNIPSHRIRLFYYRVVMKFTIEANSYIFMHVTFDAAEGLIMKKNSVINANCRIDTRGGVEIGENVSISQGVTILTADHDMDSPYMTGRQKGVKLESYVWIGTNATILPGVIIGNASVVGACSVVTKQVETFSVVAGAPARVIKERKMPDTFLYTCSYKRLFQ